MGHTWVTEDDEVEQDTNGSGSTKSMFRYIITLQYPGLEVIKLEYSLRLKIKRNEWLLAGTCP